MLARDGRASYADLAAATGWSAATVTCRLEALRSITPADLDGLATALAGHSELAFVAATTGPTNLLTLALYGHMADRAGYSRDR